MAWSYSPRRVTRSREASLGKGASKGPGLLLVLAGACAAFFVFAITIEFLGTSEDAPQEEMMIRFNGGGREEELVVKPGAEWEEKKDTLDRGYRILWKKPKDKDSEQTQSLWDTHEQEKEKEKQARRSAPWDQHGDGYGE